jgi:hypothetical protein
MLERLRGFFSHEPDLEDATYELLFSNIYPAHGAYPELVTRLSPIVLALTTTVTESEEKASRMMEAIFLEFVHQFPGAPPAGGLLRLASVIRKAVGAKAFSQANVPLLYYVQLPLYHLPNIKHRQYLQAMFNRGLSHRENTTGLAEELASEFDASPERIQAMARKAWKSLEKIVYEEFNEEELRQYTEDYLPWRKSRA